MDATSPSGFQQFEAQWEEATGTLEHCERALGEAMQVYRQHSPGCRTNRVAQALANYEEAKEGVQSLMRTIWAQLF